jgi:hypothetical protein
MVDKDVALSDAESTSGRNGRGAAQQAAARANTFGAARVVAGAVTNHKLGVKRGGGTAVAVQGAGRAAFVAHKRISAANTDFNLPISAYDRFGSAVAHVGELNNDPSTVEVAVGAPGDNTHKWDAGAVYLLSMDAGACMWMYSCTYLLVLHVGDDLHHKRRVPQPGWATRGPHSARTYAAPQPPLTHLIHLFPTSLTTQLRQPFGATTRSSRARAH